MDAYLDQATETDTALGLKACFRGVKVYLQLWMLLRHEHQLILDKAEEIWK